MAMLQEAQESKHGVLQEAEEGRHGDAEQAPAAAKSPDCGETMHLSWQNWVSLGAYVANLGITCLSLSGLAGEANADLNKKYQTLMTPAGSTFFSIWGSIFVWQGIWSVVQMLPGFRQAAPVRAVAPWWWAACLFQAAWAVAFAQEAISVSPFLMLCVLVSLVGAVLALDRQKLSLAEYLLFRAPFALHLGWIVAVFGVHLNVAADWHEASPAALLGLAISSLVATVAVATFFACGVRTPEPIVSLVVAVVLAAIGLELNEEGVMRLDDPGRFNPHRWNDETLEGVKYATFNAAAVAFVLVTIAVVRNVHGAQTSMRQQ